MIHPEGKRIDREFMWRNCSYALIGIVFGAAVGAMMGDYLLETPGYGAVGGKMMGSVLGSMYAGYTNRNYIIQRYGIRP